LLIVKDGNAEFELDALVEFFGKFIVKAVDTVQDEHGTALHAYRPPALFPALPGLEMKNPGASSRVSSLERKFIILA
jgi:hypothetical protein